MSIQRFYLGDRDIPLGGYINAIKEWFTWATSTSENLPPGEHPLTVPHGNWFKHGEKDNVIFVGTHWDGREIDNLCRSCECESGKSLLIRCHLRCHLSRRTSRAIPQAPRGFEKSKRYH